MKTQKVLSKSNNIINVHNIILITFQQYGVLFKMNLSFACATRRFSRASLRAFLGFE